MLKVKNLSKKYTNFCLDNISFEIAKGDVVGLIGRNGAGKSTLIKSILAINDFNGEIFIDGNPSTSPLAKQLLGYSAGEFNYYKLQKLKNITKIVKKFYPTWDDNVYKNYLQKFNLDENKKVKELSSGMKVKYSILLQLAHNPKLLILDEPTSGLDPVSREEILDIILQISKRGVTVLFSTHITSDVEKVADKIIFIKNGKIVFYESQDELNYYLISLNSIQEADMVDTRIFGLKETKNGYEGLIRENIEGFNLRKATLDEIMVHLEVENE